MKTDNTDCTGTENQNINDYGSGAAGGAHDAAGATPHDNLADGDSPADNVSCEIPNGGDENGVNGSANAANDAAGADAAGASSAETAGVAAPAPTPEEEAALWRDKFVRLSAEYDNYRKRTFKEKMDIIAVGGEDVVRAMLDVLDDVDRALVAITAASDVEAVKQGISLIDAKLRGALKARGLAEIEAVGEPLDTDLHEAVARIPAPDEASKGRVVDVVQKGYKLKDKIIRYAKVVVGQ